MDLQFKTFPFEVKAAQSDGSTFEGLVSAFLNVDSQGDIVDPSAFDQDLETFLADGFIGGLNHDWDNPIGRPQSGTKVVDQGLFLRANVIDTTHGLDVRKMLAAGVVRKLSIGFRLLGRTIMESLDDVMAYWESKGYTPSATDMSRAAQGYVRLLTRIHLYEGSPVTVPANDLATITAVKAAQARTLIDDLIVVDDEPDGKGATGSMSLPMGPRDREWDSSAAEKRMREWAGANDAPNAKYRKGFFWYDADNPDKFGSYKMPFADVMNGTLTAMPRAIMACAGVMQGARGGVDIPESDRAAVKARITRYYARMREAFNDPSMMPPWASMPMKPKSIPADVRGIEDLLRDAGGFSQADAKAIISQIKSLQPLQRDAESDDEPTPPDATEPVASEPEPADVTPAEAPPAEEPAEEPKAADEPTPRIVPVYEPVYSPEVLALQQRVALDQFRRFQSQIGAR